MTGFPDTLPIARDARSPRATAAALLTPSVVDLLFVCVALLLAVAGATKLTQSDGDLFAHITVGLSTLATGHVPATSTFGLTTQGVPLTSPAWLSEVIFAFAYRVGGLALIAVITGLVIAAAHATVALVIRAAGADARWIVAGTLGSIALGASHWLARPHVFSLLGAALTFAILERTGTRGRFLAVPLMMVWANLHGGWIYGLVVMALYTAGELWDSARPAAGDSPAEVRAARLSRHDIGLRLGALGLAALATVCNPYGLALHRDIAASLLDPSVTTYINEYLPPTYRKPGDVLLLIAVIGTIAVLARARLAMRTPRLLVVLATIAGALTASRNIAMFSVTGFPMVVLFAVRRWGDLAPSEHSLFSEISRRESRAVVGSWGAPAAVAFLAFGILGGRVAGRPIVRTTVDPSRFPVAAVALVRAADTLAAERIFTTWTWGGYLVFAWPEQRAFIDPLKFSTAGVMAYGDVVLAHPDWSTQLDKWRIGTVIVPRRSLLASAMMRAPAWRVWYADSTATVFRRVASPP